MTKDFTVLLDFPISCYSRCYKNNCNLNNNKDVKAKEINHDEANDIAIIQITDKVNLPGIAELGDSDSIQVGDSVVAIGNPLGKQLLGSVTSGIISAVDGN